VSASAPDRPIDKVKALLQRPAEWHAPTIEESRANIEEVTARLPVAEDVAVESARLGGVPGEWLTPTGARSATAVIYLHGGGYTAGSPRSHRTLTAELAKVSHRRVFAADYRLAPEHRFPAALEDALACYKGALAMDIAPEDIMLAGDSAGGGLAAALLLKIKQQDLPQPGAAALISPWADLTLENEELAVYEARDPMLTREGLEFLAAHYMPDHVAGGPADRYDMLEVRRNPFASPAFGDFTHCAPMLIQVGSDEVLLADAERLSETVAGDDTPVRLEVWPEMIHVWHMFHFLLPEARKAIAGMAAFFDAPQEVIAHPAPDRPRAESSEPRR